MSAVSLTDTLRDAISMAEAARLLGCHISTAWRYHLSGVRGVRLATLMQGGKRVTTRAAVEQFLAALNSSQPAPLMTLHPITNSTDAVKTLLQ